MQRRHFLAAAVAAPLASRAQSPWPSQPVKLLIAFPAGGPTDITMRVLAETGMEIRGPEMRGSMVFRVVPYSTITVVRRRFMPPEAPAT